MSPTHPQKKLLVGAGLAVLATLIWSGNFIIARSIIKEIPPVSLAFYRWTTATLILFPIASPKMRQEFPLIRKHLFILACTAFAGITCFNTLIYIAGHYTSAINLALIGNTSAPIMTIILARIFLGERITWLRAIGLFTCIAGILILLTRGNLANLFSLEFTKGDVFILIAAFSFAVYTMLVRKKPVALSPTVFLFSIFLIGTIFLVPFFIWERAQSEPIQWTAQNMGIILYLGLGTSVISFLSWNAAIARMGAARTALFGNLTVVFSSVEAVLILGESITPAHIISFVLVITGLVIANLKGLKTTLVAQA